MFRKPPPWVEGVACTLAWGVGKQWFDRLTPYQVQCVVEGLVGLCATGNGTYTLTQMVGQPCQWQFIGDRYRITWTLVAGVSSIDVFDHIRSFLCFRLIVGGYRTYFQAGAIVARIT